MRRLQRLELVLQAAGDDVEAEVQEVPEDLVQIQPLRPAHVDVAFGRHRGR